MPLGGVRFPVRISESRPIRSVPGNWGAGQILDLNRDGDELVTVSVISFNQSLRFRDDKRHVPSINQVTVGGACHPSATPLLRRDVAACVPSGDTLPNQET